jgi:hypothetical protein
MQISLHLKLDLRLTSLNSLEARVRPPNFSIPLCEADHYGNQQSHFGMVTSNRISKRTMLPRSLFDGYRIIPYKLAYKNPPSI